MYQFKIKKREDGGYRFDLGEIKMIIDGYTIKDGKHILLNPGKAIAYFNTEDNLYGVSNDPLNLNSAEALYDSISKQYREFKEKRTNK